MRRYPNPVISADAPARTPVAQTLVSAAPRLISALHAEKPESSQISRRGFPPNQVEMSLDPADTSIRATGRRQR